MADIRDHMQLSWLLAMISTKFQHDRFATHRHNSKTKNIQLNGGYLQGINQRPWNRCRLDRKRCRGNSLVELSSTHCSYNLQSWKHLLPLKAMVRFLLITNGVDIPMMQLLSLKGCLYWLVSPSPSGSFLVC